MRGIEEGENGCEMSNGHDLPVEVRGDEEEWGDEEEEQEPCPLLLDCDHWTYHLSHHLRKTEANIKSTRQCKYIK